MNNNQADIVEEMLRKYGEAPDGYFPKNEFVDMDNDYYRYYMVIGLAQGNGPVSVYYEGSDDLDELYEQAGNILHDNIVDFDYGVLAQPIAIVDTLTGNILAPILPSMIQFRQSSETINA